MRRIVEETKAQQILKGIIIPPQPQVMVDLCMDMYSPKVSMEHLAGIISKDVGISGAVLKVINSPYFGLRSKITSIQQALSLLGIGNIANIVNSLSIRSSLPDESIIGLTGFWDNAADVAVTCAAISRLTGISSPEEAYTLGLFHNCGIPLLMNRFLHYPDVIRNSYLEPNLRITDIENSMLGSNHAVLGCLVARTWKLPGYLSEAIAEHHKVEEVFAEYQVGDQHKKNLLAILKLAENTCKSSYTLAGVEQDYEFLRIKDMIFDYIGLSEYDFNDIQDEVKEMSLHQVK